MIDPNRGTGRTTRRLQDALNRMVEDDCLSVLYLCASHHEARYIMQMVLDMFPFTPTSWRFHNSMIRWGKYTLRFGVADDEMRWRGWRRGNVFIDHHVWEREPCYSLDLLLYLYS